MIRRARPATLRGKLALLALAATAAWVAVVTTAFNLMLTGSLRGQADDVLRTRAAAVAATVQVRPNGTLALHEPADDGALDTGIWIYQGTTAIERPQASATLHNRADALALLAPAFEDTPQPAAYRLYALPVDPAHPRAGTVVAAVSLNPYHRTADLALAGSITLGLLLLGGVYLTSRRVVANALQPVTVMSEQAATWSGHDTSRRFGAAARPAELAALAANLDELLNRLAAVVRHEQQLTHELSHELRTPLARIVAETEWLQARPRTPDQQQAAHRAVAESAAQMQQICHTLLSTARAGTGHLPGRSEPLAVVRALAERSAEQHPGAPRITVRSENTENPVVGADAVVLERILAPLLDNARRYAAHEIVVTCTARLGEVLVTVSDDGPGIPVAAVDAVFEPGFRADRADGHDGAGLGLALAQRLARAAGGEITVNPEASVRGACFTVTLPTG
ncbi:sensor histidine kinase [Peterkaempfera sp. SMS 1(5)a]|uniref:sensor histidine kinase n=1 Tax=Peterkaempfera podocarpi TaxID=3232308 RepID=UPI00366E7F02